MFEMIVNHLCLESFRNFQRKKIDVLLNREREKREKCNIDRTLIELF